MLVPLFSWSAVHAALAAISLVVSTIGGALFWVLYNTHSRLKELEEGQGQKEAAIFGKENNPLHVGLVKEVSELKKEVEELQDDMDDSSVEREDLKERILEVERKIEDILERFGED